DPQGFRLWKSTPERVFGSPFAAGSISADISPELLGVGYIIGPRIASIMCAGGVLAYLVLIPAIKYFGAGLTTPLAPETTALIKDMSPGAIRNAYILYIGAGAVAAGGIISVARSMPVIWHGLKGGLRDFRGGASSHPSSGMTVATLLLTCLIFVVLRWTGNSYFVTALSIGGIVCIASSNGGTTSQDLKTGFLVGATPRNQQIAILIGAFASALLLGPILLGLNKTKSVYIPVHNIPAGFAAGHA